MSGFDPGRCDLCGSRLAEELGLPIGRSLRSDQVVQNRPLRKLVCGHCGLAREAAALDDLTAIYMDSYAVAPADYKFFTATGPQCRGDVFARWFVDAFGRNHWLEAQRVLEIGSGAGTVMRSLKSRFPHLQLEGLELGRSFVDTAKRDGLDVHNVEVCDWNGGPYDIMYAIAVLEHVPSPTRFLQRLRELLRPGGILLLTQPTQDVVSCDVLFNDHLHHFGTDHMAGYAEKIGFRQRGVVVGHELMPNFSLHAWEKSTPSRSWAWRRGPGYSTVPVSFTAAAESFARCDQLISAWIDERRPLGVFGLNEVFALARAYTRLPDASVRCGLVDDPRSAGDHGFPVVVPEEAAAFGVHSVVAAVNKVWLPRIEPRLRRLGFDVCPVL